MNKEKIAEEILRLRFSQLLINEDYKAGKFKIPIHLALGHEAIAVALAAATETGDKFLLTHRNIAYHLALGATLKEIRDEYLLVASGLASGRFGSMNLIQPERGVVYASSILGNQFPVAVGVSAGESIKRNDKDAAVVVLGGDGSVEEGAFYESLLLAQSTKSPVLYLIENNEWSMHTRIDERRVPINLASLTKSLGVEYVSLKGNNPYNYIEELKRILTTVRSGQSVCVECLVTTLGDWRGPQTEEYPEGKFINYHAGPTPGVSISEWPIIRDNDSDPVFIIKNHFPENFLKKFAIQELERLKKEILEN